MMNATTKFLIAFTLMTAPLTAFAQSSDVEYCKRLSDVWRVYNRGADPDAGTAAAMAKCHGATAASIATLEKALSDEKIKLPPK